MYKGFKSDVVPLLFFGVLSAIGFFLIYKMTADPTNPSGNGNPAILIMIPTILLYLAFLYWIYKISYKVFTGKKWILIGSLVAAVLLLIAEILYVQSVEKSLESLWYFDKIGWFSQFTNKLYFNGITFFIGVTLAVMLSFLKYELSRR
ncbi:hypothetical protein [Pseudalkalibacillus caeni]|uniref:Uncharacterized protein n=1 Tax=Exobacillus caeni TaxID=2574798 RepID=A0A5R9F3Q8_9BACL|nr:hypothetical protein [Pseudalkalibacillus caeni]TLS36228.1 hypothetical protein FCL54_16470 [Pseudalkalibacillus caeni]